MAIPCKIAHFAPAARQIAMFTRVNRRNHIYVLPLDGSPIRDITVTGWSGLNTFVWSVDGKGFFTGTTTGLGQQRRASSSSRAI
jgi:hypothetical protein